MKPKILIVGGGPAGSACGIELARRGFETVLLERGAPYREKVCGDGLNFDAQKALRRLDLFDDVRRKARSIPRAVIYGYSGQEIPISETFYTLQRTELDQLLRDRVEALGGKVHYETRVQSVEVTPTGVAVRSGEEAWEGDLLVLATGAHTQLAESLGFEFPFRTAAALRGYVPNTRGVDAYLFWLSKDVFPGYAWAFPCPDGTLNLGVIYFESNPPQGTLHDLLRTFTQKTARDLIDGQDFIRPPKGFQLRTGLRRGPAVANRVLLVGENVDCTYDLSGEGIGKALESGILAAETIAAANTPFAAPDLAGYQHRLHETSLRFHEGYTRVMRVLGTPYGNWFFTRLLSRSHKAQDVLTDIVREDRPPQALFSARGLVRTLLF